MSSTAQLQDRFAYGVLCGVFLMMGVDGLHWFITPIEHPDASTARSLAVVAQVVLSFGVAAWLWFRTRPNPAPSA